MIKPPPRFGSVPVLDKRSNGAVMKAAEAKGEAAGGKGPQTKLGKFNALHTRLMSGIESLGRLPAENEGLHILSVKDLNAYTLILWMLREMGAIEELYVTTYNINQDILAAFADLLDSGKVKRLSFVVSQRIETMHPDRAQQLREIWEKRRDRMRVSLCWNHSKIFLAAGADGRKIVVSGSGNFSFNAWLENYTVFNSPATHDFYRESLELQCFNEARQNKRHKIWGVDKDSETIK